MAHPDRSDVRSSRQDVLARIRGEIAEGDRSCGVPRRARRGGRCAGQPPPPRRQPGRCRARALSGDATTVVTTVAGAKQTQHPDVRGTRSRRPHHPGSGGLLAPRDHRDTLPSRAAADHAGRGPRRRIRAHPRQRGASGSVDDGRHRHARRAAHGRSAPAAGRDARPHRLGQVPAHRSADATRWMPRTPSS